MPVQLDDAQSAAGGTAVLPALDRPVPWNDLPLLDEIVGDARVVAVGEGCHFVKEFGEARRRLIEHLAERRGFTVIAFESGFAEGLALDRRLDGPDPTGLVGLAGTTSAGLDPTMARWLFRQRHGSHPMGFLGLDIPVAGGSLRPALEPVGAYLARVDPDAVAPRRLHDRRDDRRVRRRRAPR
jgi:erythromycin esterase